MFERIMNILTPGFVVPVFLTYTCISLILILRKYLSYSNDKITKDDLLYDTVFPLLIWGALGVAILCFSMYYHRLPPEPSIPLPPKITDGIAAKKI